MVHQVLKTIFSTCATQEDKERNAKLAEGLNVQVKDDNGNKQTLGGGTNQLGNQQPQIKKDDGNPPKTTQTQLQKSQDKPKDDNNAGGGGNNKAGAEGGGENNEKEKQSGKNDIIDENVDENDEQLEDIEKPGGDALEVSDSTQPSNSPIRNISCSVPVKQRELCPK